jgi:hypothetical protein
VGSKRDSNDKRDITAFFETGEMARPAPFPFSFAPVFPLRGQIVADPSAYRHALPGGFGGRNHTELGAVHRIR